MKMCAHTIVFYICSVRNKLIPVEWEQNDFPKVREGDINFDVL